MRYLVRSLKYFVRLAVILVVVLAILMVARIVPSNVEQLFVNGYDSLWQIALLIAVFAAVYPKFGYCSRRVIVPGSDEETKPLLDNVMTSHGYAREQRADGKLCYRKTAAGDKLIRLWEDRITVDRLVSGYELEGRARDVVILAGALEFPDIR